MPCLPVETGLLCNNHMDLCVRADGPCLDPSGGTLRQGPAEGSHGLPSSTSAHQLHSDEPRPSTILLSSSLCGDLPQEGRAVRQRWERFQGSSFVRTSYGDRSHVAGPICRRRVRTAEATPRCPRVSRKGMVRRRNGDEALARGSLRRMPELGQRKEDHPRVHGRPETVHGILAPCSLRP